jgi:clusterin-associated protein 1
MSYRELRNFTEMMRTLGYQRLISMENFRKPNFELVADILFWMVKLYDPETNISDRVEYESERIEFLTNIAALMASKARIKLNTKKLYASDGRAVQELLKVASLLYKAVRSTEKNGDNGAIPPTVKVQEVKTARVLASDITQSGAKLYDLLASENLDRQDRNRSLRFLNMTATAPEGSREQQYVERCLRELVENTRQGVEDMRKECEELEADERNIESKIRKKQEELERSEKRLRSLESVRPQFMDETDKLEKELQRHYDIYVEKCRNLDYLESELEKFHKSEDERKEQQEKRLKKMRERLLKEEVDLLRGGREGKYDDDAEAKYDRGPGSLLGRPRDSASSNGAIGRQENGRNGRGRSTSHQGRMVGGDSDVSSDADDDMNGERDVIGESDDEELSVGSGDRGMGGRGLGGGRGGRMIDDGDSDEFLDDDDDDDDGADDDSGGSDEHF